MGGIALHAFLDRQGLIGKEWRLRVIVITLLPGDRGFDDLERV